MGTGARGLAALLVVLAGIGVPFAAEPLLDAVGIVALLMVALLVGADGSRLARVAGIVALVGLACLWALGYGALVDRGQGEAIRQVLLGGFALLLGLRLAPVVSPLVRRLPRVPLLVTGPLPALAAAADALVITHPVFLVPLNRAGLVETGPSPWGAVATLLVVLLVLAEGAHRYVEVPLRTALS